MDNLTHTVFAATLARTPLGRLGHGTTAALILSSNAPDLDIIAVARGGVPYLEWHRGPTHGPLGVAGLGLLTAVAVWLWRKTRPGEEPGASFGMLAAVSMIGVLLHVLMDLPTAYGTRLLSPFDWHWFAFDWLPILDVYLLLILGAGLLFGQSRLISPRRATASALVLVAALYGVRAAAHHRALALAPQLLGTLLPPRCDGPAVAPSLFRLDYWPRASAVTPAPPGGAPCLVEMAAEPTFISPFRWRLIFHLSNAYELREIDLLDGRRAAGDSAATRMSRVTVRYPNQWTPTTIRAAEARTARALLGFSRFPAARTYRDPTGVTTVRWSDMRFAGGILTLDQPVMRVDLFSVIVRLAPDGRVLEERLGR